MEIKEAIEFLKAHKVEVFSMVGKNKSSDEVIALLKRLNKKCKQGEKYEAIVGELENCLLPEQWEVVEILIKKYFPKEE